jgi:hypothetical protein
MADNDKQYINYNLSLIDTPTEAKEGFEIKVETPDEEKLDQDITSYVLNEDKPADGGSLGLNPIGLLGLAREWPLEPIDPDISVNMTSTSDKKIPGAATNATQKVTTTKDFEVTNENKGKDSEFAEITPDSYIRVKSLKGQDEDPTAASSFKTNFVRDSESSKDDEAVSAELGVVSPQREVKILREDSNPNESSSFDIVKVSESKKLKDDNTINIMNLSPFTKSTIAKAPYTQEELTYDKVVSKLNIKGDTRNLGSIHVYPANPNDEGGILSKYVIPFEFNPNINEGGRGAKFEASSMLSRIGDVQSYIKTDGMTVSLTTHYQVLTNTKADNDKIDTKMVGDHQGTGSWMDSFHLRNIQSIEMAYRGLVFPQLARGGGSFFRPPLIKIVFGESGVPDGKIATDITPFNSLLTYPYKMADGTKIYHKSFIVTKVDIKKDWENMPVIMNENNNGIIDLQGFDVSLELIEVDPMYIGVLPSFEDYYSIAKNVGA